MVIPWFVDNGRYRLEGTDESAGEHNDLQTHMAMGGTWPSVDLRQEAFNSSDTDTGELISGYQMVQPSGQPLFAKAVTSGDPSPAVTVTTFSDSSLSAAADHHLSTGDHVTILKKSGWSVSPDPVTHTFPITVTAANSFTFSLAEALAGALDAADGAVTAGSFAYTSPKFRWPADQCGWAGSPRWESMHDWAPGGCVTVLEEICD